MNEQKLQDYLEDNVKYAIGKVVTKYVLQAYDEKQKKFIYTGITKEENDILYFHTMAKNINKVASREGRDLYPRFRVKEQIIVNKESIVFNMV